MFASEIPAKNIMMNIVNNNLTHLSKMTENPLSIADVRVSLTND
jgi:hypothetical protein